MPGKAWQLTGIFVRPARDVSKNFTVDAREARPHTFPHCTRTNKHLIFINKSGYTSLMARSLLQSLA